MSTCDGFSCNCKRSNLNYIPNSSVETMYVRELHLPPHIPLVAEMIKSHMRNHKHNH